MVTFGLTVPEATSPAFSVHLFAFHPFFWREKIMPTGSRSASAPVQVRVDQPTFRDLGIALLSGDGDSLSAIGVVEWSRSKHTEKWLATFSAMSPLPPIALASLGPPRAALEAKLVRIDDACDAATRDVAASLWPTLRQALTQHDSPWSKAIPLVEHHLLIAAVERGDVERVTALLDQGAAVNTDLVQTTQLLMGDDREVRHESVTRPREAALHRAARRGHRSVLDALLARGARADATALGLAIERIDGHMVQRLLDHGADPNGLIWITAEVGSRGYTDDQATVYLQVPAITMAEESTRMALLARLVAAGGTPGLPVPKRYAKTCAPG